MKYDLSCLNNRTPNETYRVNSKNVFLYDNVFVFCFFGKTWDDQIFLDFC